MGSRDQQAAEDYWLEFLDRCPTLERCAILERWRYSRGFREGFPMAEELEDLEDIEDIRELAAWLYTLSEIW